MATKAYTDLEQSKKLAGILSITTIDFAWNIFSDGSTRLLRMDDWETFENAKSNVEIIPCWSLAALLDILPYPQLSKDKLGSGKEGWMVSVYPDNCRFDSCWHDNPIDACYEMILKLKEQKLL